MKVPNVKFQGNSARWSPADTNADGRTDIMELIPRLKSRTNGWWIHSPSCPFTGLERALGLQKVEPTRICRQ